MIFIFLFLTSHCVIGSRFIHLIRTDSNVLLFNGWVIFHCVYVPQLLYPFICQWTSRLHPRPVYCKKALMSIGIHVSFSIMENYFFTGWVILHCVYVPQLSYPFICWWTSRLLPCPGYYKQCCDEHWGTRVSFDFGFLSVYAQQWDCWVIRQFYVQFFKESPHCSP